VVKPGPKQNFEPDEKENKPESVTNAFSNFMDSKANVLLLSGAAGSGKSTAYNKLQSWILNEYTINKKKNEVNFSNGN